ncbi:phosphotransferase family protein [Nitratireductor kimnyeongensis]|uniref:Phosphotransferase family protein n=1 Tax=Nitratireductor kimnyeongensis TaxID=430679 RepID=A0ABW0T6Q1_9HYPH|nr:aminoglycoside phosphotransferase family protein [Nitratireductor kimnyeongensis]QZZ36454.1 aminoglycoside phosphotransferase family protein [Nitratireductor kimnyeongensis]
MAEASIEYRGAALLKELGLASRRQIRSVTPLAGGVASDIARIETENGDFCVKFALAKLRVKEDWHAPVHRNAAEYAWLKVASEMAADYFPKLYGRSVAANGFAMEFVTGDTVVVWKDALLERGPAQGEAAVVARLLSRVHQRSSRPTFDRSGFDNAMDFDALRLDPYLRFSAGVHPEVSDALTDMADALFKSDAVLSHGDVSPKNILFRDGAPVLLDAECATMGDASFDVAFCLNHLVLKGFHLPQHAEPFLTAIAEFAETYFEAVDWEDPAALKQRIARLLPMLMLARIDGKSPVEYLAPEHREQIRALSLSIIANPVNTLDGLISLFKEAMKS